MARIPTLRDPSFAEDGKKRELVGAVFDTVARRYDVGNDLLSLGLHRVWRHRLLRYAAIQADHRVLDLACGTGDATFLAARACPRGEVVGADSNAAMLAIAQQKLPADLPNVRFVECDAANLPFADASFDRVLISYATRGLPDLGAVVRECARVLRPGGELWNLDFARPPLRIVDLGWRATLTSWGAVVGAIVHQDPRTYMYIPASLAHYRGQTWLAELIREAGMEAETIETTLSLMAFNRGRKPV